MAERIAPAKSVLVTDCGRGSAVSIVRSLGRQGWRVVAADCDPGSAGFASRYANEHVVYPAPRESPAAFVDAIDAAVKRHAVDLVVPVTDDTLIPLAEARKRFEGVTRLAIAPPDALACVTNKERTLELARRLDVPVPRTVRVQSIADVERVSAELAWPVVIKPEASRHLERGGPLESCSVSYAADREELRARVLEAGGRYGLLLQEYCEGEGVGVEVLAVEGRPVLVFQHRRLAEIPITGGASAWRESVALDPQLRDFALRLVEALRWTGPLMVEFRQGPRPALMEINGRVWGSMPLAVMSGVDFPSRWAELCLDPEAVVGAAPEPYAVGVRAYDLDHLLLWAGNVLLGRRRHPYLPAPRRREALRALGALLNPADRWDFAARDDPRPARAELRRIPGRFWRRLRGRTATSG